MTRQNVLVYIEPYPVRIHFLEFLVEGILLCDTVSQITPDWTVFSNSFVLEELAKQRDFNGHIVPPSAGEDLFIRQSLTEWDEAAIDAWCGLIQGTGAICDFYTSVLSRIGKSHTFDTIVVCAENGAVQRFANDHDAKVVCCKSLSTREPFPPVVAVDVPGNDGRPSLCDYTFDSLDIAESVDTETCLDYLRNDYTKDILEYKFSAAADAIPLAAQRYVVVALQLCDDIDFRTGSGFKSPKAFLENVIPSLIDRGYHIVLLRTLNADEVPFNLLQEMLAVEYAKSFADKVTVLQPGFSKETYVQLLSYADAVVSANSMVCYEALLLGTPAALFGTAYFDIGGGLRKAGENLLSTGEIKYHEAECNSLTSVFTRHLLHSTDVKSLEKVFRTAFDYRIEARTCFADILIDNIDYGACDFDYLSKEINVAKIRDYFNFSIDQFNKAPEFYVRGWLFFKMPETFITAITVTVGANTYYFALHNRRDVLAVYPSAPLKCGFVLDAPLSNTASLNGALLTIISDNGFRYRCEFQQLVEPPDTALSSIVKRKAKSAIRRIRNRLLNR
jgi:hypothetical protein